MAGRPTKFFPEVAEAILEAVRSGAYLLAAANAAGIGRRTLHSWIERGKSDAEEDAPFREFRRKYLINRGLARIDCELCVHREGRVDSKMALEYLERLYPEDWSKHRGEIRKLRREIEELKALFLSGGNGNG